MLRALAIGLLLTLSPALAQRPVETELASALASLPHSQTVTSACVVDLTERETIFDFQADRPLIPASTMKLFTLAAGIAELGPDFAFETVLATDGANLYVIGNGDPGFGDEKLCRARGEDITAGFDRWADALLRAGITSAGDLVIDESIIDDQRLHPTWEPQDLGKWYAAPVGGLNFNGNCLDIEVRPGGQPGAPALVAVQPETAIVQILNQCRTGDGTPLLHHPPGTLEYKITGRCDRRWPFGSVAFPDPGLLFADALHNVLSRRGVMIQGDIRRQRIRSATGRLPDSLTMLARHRTPLPDVLARIGKDSQNLFAECLLKRAGYAWAKRRGHSQPQGTWRFGANAVAEVLHRAGINRTGLVVADGSGLSRENACTSRQLVELLTWVHGRPWGALFRQSLSVAGSDGSLRKRLRGAPDQVFAKTGTMRSVRALAGYVDSEAGRRFAFAVMFNDYPGPSTPYKRVQDEVCRILMSADSPGDRPHSR